MKILMDNNVPRLLRNNLPNQQVDTDFQHNWHTLTDGKQLPYGDKQRRKHHEPGKDPPTGNQRTENG